MKKIFLSVLAMAFAMGTFAQNELQVVPAEVTTEGTFVFLDLNNSDSADKVLNFELYIEWPDGWTIGNPSMTQKDVRNRFCDFDEDNEEYVSRFDLTSGPDPLNPKYTKYIAYSKKNKPLMGGSGHFLRVKVTPPSDVTPGFYPVRLIGGEKSNIACSGDAGSEIWLGDQTSYLVVGNPTESTLALEGKIPSFVNTALATESAVKTLDLTAVTAVNGDFTYVAGRKVIAPATDVNASVKFDAPLAGTYGSFCAPVDVNVDCYTFTSCDGTTAVFAPATTAPAGQPVLIDKAVKTAAQAAVLKTVEGRQITQGYYVANDGSGMRSVNSTATIPALRGYWDIPASSNLRIAIETPTGLQYIGTAEEVFDNTYDLQGRQTTNAKNGVFVVNGKKQFVK